MHQPRERRRVDVCVRYARYVGWSRESRLEQLVGYFLNAPQLGVAYCLTNPRLALVRRQPHRSAIQHAATWLTLLQRQPGDLVTSICFGSHISAADTLTLLIKTSATVTVYRWHCFTVSLTTCSGICSQSRMLWLAFWRSAGDMTTFHQFYRACTEATGRLQTGHYCLPVAAWRSPILPRKRLPAYRWFRRVLSLLYSLSWCQCPHCPEN